jgi:hypothetical protein
VTNWGVRVGSMNRDSRAELSEIAERVVHLRYRAVREWEGRDNFTVWSFAVLDDLRPRTEREDFGQ